MGDVIFELIAKDNERERKRTERIEDQNRTLREALKAAVRYMQPEVREDVTLPGTPDTSRYTGEYLNDLASMRAGWGLL